MLTTDLVRVRRREGRLQVPPLRPAEKKRLLGVAAHYVAAARSAVGRTRAAFEAACDEAPCKATDHKLVRGLRKLVEDRCVFEVREDVDPPALRRAVFTRAAEVRRALADDAAFDADAVIESGAAEFDVPADEVRDALFADLRENHLLTAFDAISAPALMEAYETARKQAVLLRRCASR